MTCSYCDSEMMYIKEEDDADEENFLLRQHMKCPRCPTTAVFTTIVPRPPKPMRPLKKSIWKYDWVHDADEDPTWHCAER